MLAERSDPLKPCGVALTVVTNLILGISLSWENIRMFLKIWSFLHDISEKVVKNL